MVKIFLIVFLVIYVISVVIFAITILRVALKSRKLNKGGVNKEKNQKNKKN